MRKVKGLTKRLAAMALSGLLVVGAVPGTALASESPEDLGQTAETAAEDLGQTLEISAEEMGDTLSEEVSAEGFSEDAALQGEEAAVEYYTVILDANGGYFENEWDDAIGEIVERAEVISKQIPAHGTVAAAPVFTEMDQDGQAVTFAGWSLEPDGESVTAGDDEYAPVDSCTLYAVWEAEDPSAGDIGSDIEGQEIAEENTDQIDSAQDSVELEEIEGPQDVQDYNQDTDEVETEEGSATGQDAWDNGTAEESSANENPVSEAGADSETLDENEQAAASDQEADYADEEAEKAVEESSDAAISVEETQAELNESSREEETVREDAANGVVESGTCGDNLTWTLDEEGTLTISGSGEMYDYDFQGSPFYNNGSISNVVIEDGVTSIGSHAFCICSSLNNITIPESVTSIGYSAFIGCMELKSITIPEGVTSIGNSVFLNCFNLRSITIPEGVTSIGQEAFRNCGLVSITIPEGVTSIGDEAFSGCGSLSSITIPEGVTSINRMLFYECTGLTTILIPAGVTSIGDIAFSKCGSLSSITIPEGVTSIGQEAFCQCGSLSSITIPESVSNVGDDAFSDCPNLTISGNQNTFIERYCVDFSIPFNPIDPMSISSAVVTLPDQTYIYTGEALEPKAVVFLLGDRLTKGIDYTVAYSNNTNAGTATVTINGVLRYSGSVGTTFTIEKAEQSITASDMTLTYPNTGTITVSDNKGALSYKSSNTAIAMVDPAGKVTAKGAGSARITITAAATPNYNAATKTITVTVAKAAQSITASNLSLTYPNTGTIKASGNKTDLSYKSSNTAVATVDSAGKVTAKGAGSATITITAAATSGYNAATKTITVTVAKAAQSITASDMTLTYPNSGKIEVSGNHGELSYKSSDTNIVTVDSEGKVTATGAGTATVTITAEQTPNYNNAATKTITVTVAKAAQSITASNLSLTYPNTGTITVSGNKGALSYKSSNTAIATVDSAGKVTAKGAGKATITITAAATSNYNAATKTITVTVAKAAQSITAKAAASSIAVGKTTTVSITGNKGAKSYKSSNTTIATVTSAGKVTAKKVGTVKITATSAATSNYNAASKTVTIKVVPLATESLTAANQATGIKLTWKKVTGANGYKVYRGSTLIKTITSVNTVTFADTKANTNGTKYTYKVVAKASTGDSTLSKSVAVYRVARPAVSSVTNSASKKMTVKWGKNAKANGYQIQYSTDKTFKSGNKAVTVTSASTVSKVIGSLTKGKTYYVKIRSFKNVGGTRYWSVWSSARSVKISK